MSGGSNRGRLVGLDEFQFKVDGLGRDRDRGHHLCLTTDLPPTMNHRASNLPGKPFFLQNGSTEHHPASTSTKIIFADSDFVQGGRIGHQSRVENDNII